MTDPSPPAPAMQSMTCPGCGEVYDLTAEYLANFAGQVTACARCGAAMRVPGGPAGSEQPSEQPGAGGSAGAWGARYWREGNLLVVEKRAQLPPRCVRCGADAPPPLVKYTARWSYEASVTRSAKASFLIFLLSHLKRRVAFGLCPWHKRLRRFAIGVGWAFLVFGVTTLVVMLRFMEFMEFPQAGAWVYLFLAALLLIGVSPFWLFAAKAVLEVTYINPRLARFKGASPHFLEGLPPPPVVEAVSGEDMGIVP